MHGLTTEGMKGGVIFFAIRSSQLIGEKKEWYLSSSWEREQKTKNIHLVGTLKHKYFNLSPVVSWLPDLQSHPSRRASWCGPSAGAPPAAPVQSWKRWV